MARTRFINFISLLFNLLILVIVVVCIASFFTKVSYLSELDFFVKVHYDNLKVKGFQVLKYYTVDSNIFAAVAALIMVIDNVIVIFRKKQRVSSFALTMKYISAVALTVTFITVVCYLGPTAGFHKAFGGRNFVMHLIVPFLVLLSFLFFEKGEITFFHSFMSIFPTFIYSGFYIYNVVFASNWKDIYYLNKNNAWQISFTAMNLGTMLVGIIIWLLHRKSTGNIEKL